MTSMEVTVSDEHSSLVQYVMNCGCKKMGLHSKGRLLALPANTTSGQKLQTMKNTLAYYNT